MGDVSLEMSAIRLRRKDAIRKPLHPPPLSQTPSLTQPNLAGVTLKSGPLKHAKLKRCDGLFNHIRSNRSLARVRTVHRHDKTLSHCFCKVHIFLIKCGARLDALMIGIKDSLDGKREYCPLR